MTHFPQKTYEAYTYSYPHKTAYRHLAHPQKLENLWDREDRSALFLYFHVPFCEMRCGFCNLFTVSRPKSDLVDHFLAAAARQLEAAKDYLGTHKFVRGAIGGGTPSYLSVAQLELLFELLSKNLHYTVADAPTSVEVSPHTMDSNKLALFENFGVQRLSIGVQSFDERELSTLIRPQEPTTVNRVLEQIKKSSIPILNMDLIYGMAGQTEASWQQTLERTLKYAPEEVYLYPIYVREKTGMMVQKNRQNADSSWESEEGHKRLLYRQARDFLLEQGYEQVSMRMFQQRKLRLEEGPNYSCQDDGMVGFGAGARSYTKNFHYCSEYAVSRKGVQSIIEAFNRESVASFQESSFGFQLNRNEQQRRYLIQSLLLVKGLDLNAYEKRFSSVLWNDFPVLQHWVEAEWCREENGFLKLTETGMERADAIGPFFYSEDVKERMEGYDFR